MIKRIILAAAICAALGACGMETVMAAGEHSSEKEEVTVIKGKVLRTEKVKKEDVHKEIRQAEKKEKAKKAKKEKKNALPVLMAEMPAPKAEPAAKAAPAQKADAPKVQPPGKGGSGNGGQRHGSSEESAGKAQV